MKKYIGSVFLVVILVVVFIQYISVGSAQGLVPNAGYDQYVTINLATATSTRVFLDGSHSTSTDSTIVAYRWFGASADPDDVISPLLTLTPGVHTFQLQVEDAEGVIATDEVKITVARPEGSKPCNSIDDNYDGVVDNFCSIPTTGLTWPSNYGDTEIALWKDDKLAALSITIDDNNALDHDWWIEKGNQYGFKFTWFAVTDFLDDPTKALLRGTWADFQELLNFGHDVQSHSASHAGLYPFDDEYRLSKEALESHYTNHEVLAIAYPGPPAPPYDVAIARKYYVGGRGTATLHNKANNINYSNTYSSGYTFSTSTTYWASLTNLTTYNPSYPNSYRAWHGMHFHGVGAIKPQTDQGLAYLKANEDKIWVGLYKDIVLYGQERDTTKVTVTERLPDSITFTLTDILDDTMFDYPLTLKVRLDASWQNVEATQNGQSVPVTLVTNQGVPFALVQAVPDKGIVVINKQIFSTDLTPPSVPENLTGEAISETRIDLDWSNSTDDVGVTGYKIYRGGNYLTSIQTSLYSDTTVSADTQYSYTVSAYDAAGNESAQSSPISVTTPIAPPPPASGLVARFTFDDTTEDVVGNNDGTVVGNLTYTDGQINRALSWPGVAGARVSVNNSPALQMSNNSPYTIAYWLNLTSLVVPGNSFAAVLTKSNFSSSYAHLISSAGQLNVYTSGDFGVDYAAPGFFSGLTNTWVHVVQTYDGNKISLYKNGNLFGASGDGVTFKSSSLPLYLGSNSTATYPLRGQMDDLRIYDRALSVTEVGNLYEDTTPPPPPAPSVPTLNLSASPTSVTSGATSTLTWTSTDTTACTASGAWSGTKSLSGNEVTSPLTQDSTFTLTCSDAEGGNVATSTTVTVMTAPPPPPPTAGPILHFTFDQSSISGTTVANDGSGNFTGTAYNNPTIVAGRIGEALSLNGVNQYIKVNSFSSSNLTQGGTIGFWLYYPASVSGKQFIDSVLSGNFPAIRLFNTNGKMRFQVDDSTGGNPYAFDKISNSTIPLNTWVHYALSFSPSGVTLYKDGVPDGTMLGSASSIAQPANFVIGANIFGSGQINGLIDDLRVYDRILSASEIQELYNGTLASALTSANIASPSVAGTSFWQKIISFFSSLF